LMCDTACHLAYPKQSANLALTHPYNPFIFLIVRLHPRRKTKTTTTSSSSSSRGSSRSSSKTTSSNRTTSRGSLGARRAARFVFKSEGWGWMGDGRQHEKDLTPTLPLPLHTCPSTQIGLMQCCTMDGGRTYGWMLVTPVTVCRP
jgi:hypothetical protein